MHFNHPYLLNLLWALILVFGVMVYGILKRNRMMASFAKSDILRVIAPGYDPGKSWVRAFLITAALAFVIISLSGPQMGFKWEKTNQKGVDIMIALDCSKSMLAEDIKPNRLERAKREIIDLLNMMRSDRAGLVAFSGRAILQCPLTLDHEAFNIFLKTLNPGFLPVGGTNIGHAVNACYKGFEKESDTEKAIIIITDGESTVGDVEQAAKRVAKEGIKIFCIGVGDIAGAPIPDEAGGFLKDSQGHIVLSKVDEKNLEKIADLTGGIYARSVAGDMDLDMIYKDKILGTMERKSFASGKKKVWENRFQWFLFPGVLLLLIELFLSIEKRTKQKKNLWPIMLFVSVLSIVWFNNTSIAAAKNVSSSVKSGIEAFNDQDYIKAKKHFIDAQLEDSENMKLYYNIGVAAYMNEEYDQAETNFKQALESEDRNLRHDAGYNLANTHYRLGNLEDAIKEYENILKEFPEDTKAKENLEFVKKKKEEKNQQNSKSDKDKKDSKKDKEKQDQERQKSDKEKESEQKENQNQDQSKKSSPPEPENGHRVKQADLENGQKNQAAKSMENMLNRLEDKPGKAMIPAMEKEYIEKEW